MWNLLVTLFVLLSPVTTLDFPPGEPPAPGELVITELMVNPDSVRDQAGEYIELQNVSTRKLQLFGLVVRDDGADWFSVDGFVVADPDDFVVLARKGGPGVNGGVRPDYVYGHRLSLSNTQDEVVVELHGYIIDEVAYDAKEWGIMKGASLELDPLCTDSEINDISGAWFPAVTRMSGGDLGTPGESAAAVTGRRE
jgi:hypothetical protein